MKTATQENELIEARSEGMRRGVKDIALGGMVAVCIVLSLLIGNFRANRFLKLEFGDYLTQPPPQENQNSSSSG